MTTLTRTDDVLEQLGAALVSAAEELISAQIDAAAGYAPYRAFGISQSSLRRSAQFHLDVAVAALGGGSRDVLIGRGRLAGIVRERGACGLPLDVLLDGLRFEQRVVRDWCVAEVRSRSLSDTEVLDALTVLTDAADEVAGHVVRACRDARTGVGLLDERRSSVVRRLLWPLPELPVRRDELSALGLQEGSAYRAVWAKSETDAEMLCSQLQSQVWHRGGGVLAEVDGAVVGVISAPPVSGCDTDVVAVGDARPLSDAHLSYRTAVRVMEAAERFGVRGVVTADRLGLRLAIASDADVSRVLSERYLDPLDSEGEFGEVLADTAYEFLRHGGQIKRTAREMHVHPNTLKHRLQRFQSVTSCDVSDPRTVAELWWVLEARTSRHRGKASEDRSSVTAI